MTGEKAMRNLKVTLEYEGTHFFGFQVQRHGRTVQGELQNVLEKITGVPIKLYAAGRTDTGVHALGQVVNFHTDCKLSTDHLKKGINSLLPPDIAVTKLEDVAENFHARFSAVSRAYVYSILNSHQRSPFKRNFFYHVPEPLDTRKMFKASEHLIGEKDFSSFRASSDASKHSVRNMIKAGGWVEGSEIHLYYEANAFLQHMIRNIVGTLLLVGRGRITPKDFLEIIEARDRTRAGPSVPAHGLCLIEVKYR